ncbi:MAG: tRNA preQ1(34) S-adenosylmethionine ribosyltransferase-isomerase QueA [Erysipelotrichaceae bacterium]|nr:tRNA preQ1(34) S-adenosylmethionine ribosyltransferase-isomerase QueA [Erysipelotrichaceae bacterium]
MEVKDFDFDLPEELIAQTPLKERARSRLLVLDKKTGKITHKHFEDIIDYLKPGDVLVRNNTKVIPARIFGIKDITNAKIECLLLKQIEGNKWECLIGNAKVAKLGTKFKFSDKLSATCVEVKDEGIRVFDFDVKGIFYEVLEEIGNMPLPPYIHEKLNEKDRYQTVYAKINGSAAAPTAGFHFTNELLEKIKEKGIIIADVTLHIGLGTFRPVSVEKLEDHHMHTEHYYMSKETADILNKAKEEKRRIISVGTTSTRTLESVYAKYNTFKECEEDTSIFIYPGYTFKAIDNLITNFHLPKSTLVMLVSALAGKENILNAYQEAIKERYRFFSFGDSMFIK